MRSSGILLLIPLLLSACGGEEFQDLRDFVKNSGADLRGKVDPPPEIKPYEPLTYDNSLALPDPFKPRKAEVRSGGQGINQPDLERRKEALEEFALESLKMVGFCPKQKLAMQSCVRPIPNCIASRPATTWAKILGKLYRSPIPKLRSRK